MHRSVAHRITLTLIALSLCLPHIGHAAESWAIPAGQEALLEKALAPTPAWPMGWSFLGANINHGVIDVRYRDPTGVGLGVRLQHPEHDGGPRQAGPFEIASISAELPDDVIGQIKKQLELIPEFKWTPLRDREGEGSVDAAAPPTPTTPTAGDAAPGSAKNLTQGALDHAMKAFRDGRSADADRFFDEAVRLGGLTPEALYARAVILRDRNPAQAIADLQAYQKALPTLAVRQAEAAVQLEELMACHDSASPERCRQIHRVTRRVAHWWPGIAFLAVATFAALLWRRRRTKPSEPQHPAQ